MKVKINNNPTSSVGGWIAIVVIAATLFSSIASAQQSDEHELDNSDSYYDEDSNGYDEHELAAATQRNEPSADETVDYEDDDADADADAESSHTILPTLVVDVGSNSNSESTATTLPTTSAEVAETATASRTTDDVVTLPTTLPKIAPISSEPNATAANADAASFGCPSGCRCADSRTQLVNCTGAGLLHIPALPDNVRQLDLSHNQIASIDAGTFAVTPQLRHVWLQHNQLTAVSAEAFAGAAQLQTVDLSANRIVAVDANAFRDAAASLTDVSLAANPLVLSTMVPLFSGATALRTLNLAGCNLTELHGSTFDGLTGLIGLNLRNNSLDENLNIAAFAKLPHLKKLQLRTMPSESDTKQLCETLQTIDIISSDQFDISCYELTSGQTFEESKNTPAPPKERLVTTTTPKPTTTIMSATIMPTKSSASSHGDAAPVHNQTTAAKSSHDKLPNAQNPTPSNNASISTSTTGGSASPASADTEAAVHIGRNTLRHILVATICVALVGLAIGLCFRIDVCGVKTKLCRSRHTSRGPTATDQVRPAEQVPLKEIELKEIKLNQHNSNHQQELQLQQQQMV